MLSSTLTDFSNEPTTSIECAFDLSPIKADERKSNFKLLKEQALHVAPEPKCLFKREFGDIVFLDNDSNSQSSTFSQKNALIEEKFFEYKNNLNNSLKKTSPKTRKPKWVDYKRSLKEKIYAKQQERYKVILEKYEEEQKKRKEEEKIDNEGLGVLEEEDIDEIEETSCSSDEESGENILSNDDPSSDEEFQVKHVDQKGQNSNVVNEEAGLSSKDEDMKEDENQEKEALLKTADESDQIKNNCQISTTENNLQSTQNEKEIVSDIDLDKSLNLSSTPKSHPNNSFKSFVTPNLDLSPYDSQLKKNNLFNDSYKDSENEVCLNDSFKSFITSNLDLSPYDTQVKMKELAEKRNAKQNDPSKNNLKDLLKEDSCEKENGTQELLGLCSGRFAENGTNISSENEMEIEENDVFKSQPKIRTRKVNNKRLFESEDEKSEDEENISEDVTTNDKDVDFNNSSIKSEIDEMKAIASENESVEENFSNKANNATPKRKFSWNFKKWGFEVQEAEERDEEEEEEEEEELGQENVHSFFDEEAQLSGEDDDEPDDLEEEELDDYEAEAIEEDLPSEEEIHDENAKFH